MGEDGKRGPRGDAGSIGPAGPPGETVSHLKKTNLGFIISGPLVMH